MNTKDIVRGWLEANGYDGLFDAVTGECGCETSDLMPCQTEGIDRCEPGYKTPCPQQGCGEHSWHISKQADRPRTVKGKR